MASLQNKKDNQEEQLESALFGAVQFKNSVLPDASNEESFQNIQALSTAKDSDLFVVDTGNAEDRDDIDKDEILGSGNARSGTVARKAVWEDDDDDDLEGGGDNDKSEIDQVSLLIQSRTKKLRRDISEESVDVSEYEQRLRSQYESIYGRPKWAQMDNDVDEDLSAAGRLLASTKSVLDTQARLGQSKIEFTRLKDVNFKKYFNGVVTSLSWYPLHDQIQRPIICASSLDKSVKLYKIGTQAMSSYGLGEDENEQLHSFFFQELGGVRSAQFSPDGQEIVVTGRRRFFYGVDVATGKDTKIPQIQTRSDKFYERFRFSPDGKWLAFAGDGGDVIMCDAKSKMFAFALTLPNGAGLRDFDFTADGQFVVAVDAEANVCIWSMSTRRCVNRFKVDGALHATKLKVGEMYTYIGDDCGIVSMYDTNSILKRGSSNVPVKSLTNLTTGISCLSIGGGNDELMCMGSKVKKDQLRIVNANSGQPIVYGNWPNLNTPLGHVQCAEFSPSAGNFAVGNDKGRILLYRFPQYNL
ncbi:hypothetical protein MP228_006283 [Amoeboaphelidium protococcarum]|nr:hypothetical protein MP228_006283 [Amoeboaphelidium protococcarum]